MLSSEMLHYVAVVRTDISVEHGASAQLASVASYG
jgi:hypothetical protein